MVAGGLFNTNCGRLCSSRLTSSSSSSSSATTTTTTTATPQLATPTIIGSLALHATCRLAKRTACVLRRSPNARAGGVAQGAKSGAVSSGVIGALRAGNKSLAGSSASGLSTANSGQSIAKPAAYCFNQQHQLGFYQHSAANQYLQHHYQQPPTADLLGTGYQCQPQPQYPIYHLAAANHNQTTRLIWNNGNGTSPDGFTIDGGSYMPLSCDNAPPRSDSGSVYQTIY